MESLRISEIGESKKVKCGKYRITFKRNNDSFLIFIEKRRFILDVEILVITEKEMQEDDFFSWDTTLSGQNIDFVLRYRGNTKTISLVNNELRIIDLVLDTQLVFFR